MDARRPLQPTRSRRARLAAELRSHAFAYGVVAALTLAGPLYTAYFFPEAPPALSAVGGVALGIYASMCAVYDKLL